MAIAYLNNGSVDLAAANWSDAIGLASSATCVIDRGGQAITTNLDWSSAITVTRLSYLHIRRPFTGQIGGSDIGPLKINASTNIYYAAGGGALYWQSAGPSSNTTVLFEMPVGTGGKCYMQGGTVTEARIYGSECFINGSTVVTTMYAMLSSSVIEYNATAITTLTVTNGATVYLKRSVTTLNVIDGKVIIDGDGISITTLNQYGGIIDHRSGDIPTFNQFGGVYTAQQLRRDSTIASTAATIYPGASGALQRAPGATVTWTTANITYVGTNAGPSYYYGSLPEA
jgi:hypothetical protein